MAVGVNAQVTTSAMTGKVTDSTGETVIGASVQAVHEPSGTRYGAVTNVDGRYSIQGMRTGGPYRVEISYVGYQKVTVTDVTLSLGATYDLPVTMNEASELLGDVVVVATRSKFSQVKTGASTNVSNSEMMNMPTTSRSISSLAKLSPYSNGMSFAGSDGRSTNFTVDGANFNNNFGLSSSLPGGGTPISLDAIEEIQFVVAPYDVRQSNFVGGGINAVTKSGTNTFKGTAYTYFTNQALRGNKLAGEDLGERKKESRTTYGATLGGPIIKDKLFFFVNFEMTKEPREVISNLPDKSDATRLSDLQRVKDKLVNDYGYDPGSWDSYSGDTDNTKLLARLDWNITDKHRLSVRYNLTKNTYWYAPNGNSCDDNFRNKSYNRGSAQATAFSNNMYSQKNNVWSVAAELNSRFNNKVSNQAIFTYTNIDDKRGSNSSPFPHIDIMTGDYSSGNFIPYMSFGYELFTWNNGVANKVANFTDNLTAYLGNHKLTAGVSYEHQMANNSYMRNGTGYYRFACVDDFLNGNTPLSFALTYGYNGEKNPSGVVKYNQLGVYIQDDWNISPRFKLNYGVRADALIFDDSYLTRNNAVYTYSMKWRDTYYAMYQAGKISDERYAELQKRVLDTGSYPKTHPQISPRVGFNWDIKGDKSIILRGGTGLFMGRLPLVFFTNMPQYSGTIQGSASKGNYSASIKNGQLVYTPQQTATLNSLINNGLVTTDVNEMINILNLPTSYDPSSSSMGSSSYVSAVDQDFHMPQIWKSSLAVDYKIPVSFPLTVSAEFMYNKTVYGVTTSNWNINKEALTETFSGADNRIDYSAVNYKYGKTQAYVLTNTKKGWGYNANLTIKAEPAKNLNVMASYTRTESKEISGMPGSAAESTYTGTYTISGNEFMGLQRSEYVIPDKVMVNVGYFIPFKKFHGNGLHINAIYTAYSGGGYSYIYSNDMNGDGNGADLLYIPANKFELAFKDEDPKTGISADREAFWAFVNNDPYLSSHKGEYAEAYAARSPWVHNLDLRIAEDFTFKVGKSKHSIEVSANIENLLNMFSSKLGVAKWSCYGNGSTIAPLKYEGKTAAGRPIYSFNKVSGEYPTEAFSTWYDGNSKTQRVWNITFGVKYRFN
ncbi:MAG: carboxypeptidase regulatory-like domain-containing protein [Bacteroidales bacterium]|nr:carboxypeptidase regulatory-like domain-containing protein [Bacteroidales bacterium]